MEMKGDNVETCTVCHEKIQRDREHLECRKIHALETTNELLREISGVLGRMAKK